MQTRAVSGALGIEVRGIDLKSLDDAYTPGVDPGFRGVTLPRSEHGHLADAGDARRPRRTCDPAGAPRPDAETRTT